MTLFPHPYNLKELNELNNIKEKMEKECIMNEVIKKNIEELD